jgi:hypothetical protein
MVVSEPLHGKVFSPFPIFSFFVLQEKHRLKLYQRHGPMGDVFLVTRKRKILERARKLYRAAVH